MTMWMVRSGRGGRWVDDFLTKSLVGLGWHGVGDSTKYQSKSQLIDAMSQAYPEMSLGSASSGASQLWRFQKEVKPGDHVITYDAGSRSYYLGIIEGEVKYVPGEIEELTLQRDVEWTDHDIGRDDLSSDARNRLGSTLTLFKVPLHTANEIVRLISGEPAGHDRLVEDEDAHDAIDPFESVIEEATLRIADSISKLDWQSMQELVAALLRAMSYRTEISPVGPDRGIDIFASPDGFGFEQPRIVVEVKHRPRDKMDAPAIRSFLGGRHKDDRGLYVSTGGFTKDAHYEAERSNIPLKLMTLDDLARAVVENYERFDDKGRSLLPLKKLYWPV